MISAFEQFFTSLQGKKIAVLGLGVSNRPLVRLLLEFGCDVTGCDRTPREKLDQEVLELETMGCRLRVGDGYLEGVEADVLFRTPGMHPGNPAIQALAAKVGELGSGWDNSTAFISHGDCLGEAEALADILKEKYGVKEVHIGYVGAVIGSHAGPGTIALFFLGNHR